MITVMNWGGGQSVFEPATCSCGCTCTCTCEIGWQLNAASGGIAGGLAAVNGSTNAAVSAKPTPE